MNADPKRIRPPKWNSLRSERMSYDSLKPCCNIAFRRFDESFDPDDPLDEECLSVAIDHWNTYSQRKLHLFAEIEGNITQLVVCKGDVEPTTVLVRLNGDRWEGCGYYRDEANDEFETCDTSTLLSTESVSHRVLSLVVYPGITTVPEASHDVPLPSDSENIDEKFKSELETVLTLSKPLLIAISGIVPAMEKLAISLDEVKPRPRAAIPPIPETSYTGPKQPDSAFSQAPAADKNDTRAHQPAASSQLAQEKDASSATSYNNFDRDDSASDSD